MLEDIEKPKKGKALKAAKQQMYRAHVLPIAEELFADQGYAQTRMQDIAQAAEISLSTLYELYSGKQKLYRQLLIQRDEEMMARVMAAGQKVFGGQGDLSQILELMSQQVAFLLEHPAYLRMQLQDGLLWVHSTSRPSDDEQALWERGLALLEQLFSWGMQNDLFLPGDPVEQGRMLISLQQTRLSNWLLAGMQEPHSEVVARIQNDFVRFFCTAAVAQEYFQTPTE